MTRRTATTTSQAALALVCACASMASGAIAADRASIAQVAWLQGCWEATTPRGSIEEHWTSPRAGTMLEAGRTIRDDRVTEYEFVVLREQDGRLAYEAHPSGQPSAVFLSRPMADESVVFENPGHDFPQVVGYRRAGPDTLSAWIEGTVAGTSRRVAFEYRRVSCDGAR